MSESITCLLCGQSFIGDDYTNRIALTQHVSESHQSMTPYYLVRLQYEIKEVNDSLARLRSKVLDTELKK